MHPAYEELDFRHTALGELLLRRRKPVRLPDTWVYEVKLDERFLMSSLVHVGEDELARLALERLEGNGWRVLVAGLGLGHTAAAALAWEQVGSLLVVEYLSEVIAWHERELVPLGAELRADRRCRFVEGDAFARLRAAEDEPYDAVLIDVDDSPEHLLSPAHGTFYTDVGLDEAARSVRPGGVFGLWTAGPVQPAFLERLRRVFETAEAHAIEFDQPLHEGRDENTVYVAVR